MCSLPKACNSSMNMFITAIPSRLISSLKPYLASITVSPFLRITPATETHLKYFIPAKGSCAQLGCTYPSLLVQTSAGISYVIKSRLVHFSRVLEYYVSGGIFLLYCLCGLKCLSYLFFSLIFYFVHLLLIQDSYNSLDSLSSPKRRREGCLI